MSDYQVIALPALKDNYLWLLAKGHSALLIDPGDANVCMQAIDKYSLNLDAIWITHHHNDHTGGLEVLDKKFNCPVYGPKDSRINFITHILDEGKCVEWQGNFFNIWHLPGHTNTHIVYWNPATKHLFCGDILFSAGCGRVMEGEAADLYHSLQRIAQLPEDTRIFCAHEYTLSNLQFALHLEPDNQQIQQRYQEVKKLRAAGSASIPTHLKTELATNPFLRSHLVNIRQKLDEMSQQTDIKRALSCFRLNTRDEYYFAVMRLWKNIYV